MAEAENQNTINKVEEVKQEKVSQEEDSVLKDIDTAKKLANDLMQKVSAKLSPGLNKVKEKGGNIQPGSLVDKSFIKKTVKLFVVGLLLIALIYTGVVVFRMLQQEASEVATDGLTPTPGDYRPYGPSVYADDPVILQLEEDVNVLAREIAGKNLRESSLNPPRLDWDINFEE